MSSKHVITIAVALGLLACTPQTEPRGPVVIDPPTNAAGLRGDLAGLGFEVAESDNGLPARLTISSDDPRAACRTIYIRDRFGPRSSRGRFVDPDQVVVDAYTTDEGSLSVIARGRYLNRYDNIRTMEACDVSAEFEAEIRTALSAG